MTTPTDDIKDSLNPMLDGEIQQPMATSAESGGGKQNVSVSDSTPDGPEKLLDLDGLLKIAELISGIRKDGRLGN